MVRKKAQTTSEDIALPKKQEKNDKLSATHSVKKPLKNPKEHHHGCRASSEDSFRSVFGFDKQDLASWNNLVRLLCRPTDPALLGFMRFLFGVLMMLDTLQERGWGMVDVLWGTESDCRFPLFNFLRPLPLQWMYVLYLVMLAGAAGVMLGFFFRLSCVLYLIPYWYLFFLDKTAWNNHSYLFGILAFQFALSDANRYWSLDGLFNPKINNAHIPLWNYTLMRTQIFLVYFIAGLKKLDLDWVTGYSMQDLSQHWVFDPLKLLLTEPQIDLYIVHLGGLTIDLFIGFLLFFDKTRPMGFLISSSFHLMNSQIFSIGMFPFAMLATQLLFCYPNWPRRVFQLIPPSLRMFTPEEREFQPSAHCVYSKQNIKSEDENSSLQMAFSKEAPPTSPNYKHKIFSAFTIAFISWQCFLPYSHGITKGYNNWTNGLYGYSWDMMVHAWRVQHIRITYHDKDTGQKGYLDPMVWTGGNRRWSSHGDMIKQFATCISHNLKNYNLYNVEIYFDIWRSLNKRFMQRMINPDTDMIAAEWSPFKSSPWLMPLMVDLSDWRGRLEEIYTDLQNGTDESADVVFVADFPGLFLENYVQPDFGNTSLSVLDGRVVVELLDTKKNITLGPGESVQIPADTFHNVHTVSAVPSCYMYLFVNTTEQSLMEKYLKFEEDFNKSNSIKDTLKKYHHDPHVADYQKILTSKQTEKIKEKPSLWQMFKEFLRRKYNLVRRSIRLSTGAVYCLATNSSFDEFLNKTYQWEKEEVESVKHILGGHAKP